MGGAARDDQEPPASTSADPSWRDELEAMTAVGTAIENLDREARERVLNWMIARYGFKDR